MAQLYASHGVDVFIDDVCVPPVFADQYAFLFGVPHVRRILLMPELKVQLERTRSSGAWDHVLVEDLSWIYEYLAAIPKDGWIVLDSSDWTIEQTVDKVWEHMHLQT